MRTLIFAAVLALAFAQPAIAQTALEKMQQKADRQKASPKKAQPKANAMQKKIREVCTRQADQKKLRGNERRRHMENCGKG